MVNLAGVLRDLGKYKEAVDWYRKALDGVKTLSEEDPSLKLDILEGLAEALQDQGEISDAKEIQRMLNEERAAMGGESAYLGVAGIPRRLRAMVSRWWGY